MKRTVIYGSVLILIVFFVWLSGCPYVNPLPEEVTTLRKEMTKSESVVPYDVDGIIMPRYLTLEHQLNPKRGTATAGCRAGFFRF